MRLTTALFLTLVLTAPLFAAPVPPPLASYSARWSDSYELSWPNGELVPLYDQADRQAYLEPDQGHLSGLVRRIPQEEFDRSIKPQALAAVRLLRKGIESYPSAELIAKLPYARQQSKPPPAPKSLQRVWVVDFSLRTGDVDRSWYVTSVTPADPEILDPVKQARNALRDRWTRLFSREAYSYDDKRASLANWKPDPAVLAVGRFLSPHLGILKQAWDSESEMWCARVMDFADPAGKLNKPFVGSLFDESDAYFGESDFGAANFSFTDGAGRLLVEGRVADSAQFAHLRRQAEETPRGIIAWEQAPRTFIGNQRLLYRQVVVASPRGDLFVVPGGLSVTDAGRRFLTLVIADAYPTNEPVRLGSSSEALDTACKLAEKLEEKHYMDKVGQLDGEVVADPKFAGRPNVRFTNRTTRVPDTQLKHVAQYLQEYYRSLGYKPRIEPCVYRGVTYHNVVVDIPGKEPDWVLMADHYDTAPAYDTWKGPSPEHPGKGVTFTPPTAESILTSAYKGTRPRHNSVRERLYHLDPGVDLAKLIGLDPDADPPPPYTPVGLQAAPGADDNASASAVLMETGWILAHHAKDWRPQHGIRLVHLFGEEFPAESFGARAYVARALADGEKIRGLVLMDMIGNAGPRGRFDDGVFQLSRGESVRSGLLAGTAQEAFEALKGRALVPEKLSPKARGRFDIKSFLFQTDGIIFSDAGYPVIVFNEHMNKKHHLFRTGYHDRKDNRSWICAPYAVGVARVALATTLLLAQ